MGRHKYLLTIVLVLVIFKKILYSFPLSIIGKNSSSDAVHPNAKPLCLFFKPIYNLYH